MSTTLATVRPRIEGLLDEIAGLRHQELLALAAAHHAIDPSTLAAARRGAALLAGDLGLDHLRVEVLDWVARWVEGMDETRIDAEGPWNRRVIEEIDLGRQAMPAMADAALGVLLDGELDPADAELLTRAWRSIRGS